MISLPPVQQRSLFQALIDKGAFESCKQSPHILDFIAKIWDIDLIPSTDSRFKTMRGDIQQHYINNNFANNTLSVLQPMTTTLENRDVLKELYQFRQKAFSDLFFSLTTTESNGRDMLSPNCAITDCSQLDHYIPKSKFPEF